MLCFLLFSGNKRVVYFTAGTVEVIDKNWKEGEIIIFLHVISNVYVFTFFLALGSICWGNSGKPGCQWIDLHSATVTPW